MGGPGGGVEGGMGLIFTVWYWKNIVCLTRTKYCCACLCNVVRSAIEVFGRGFKLCVRLCGYSVFCVLVCFFALLAGV